MSAISISNDKGQTISTTLTDSEAATVCLRTGNEFASKLVFELRKYGRLFPNKRFWLHKLAIEQIAREFEAQRRAESGTPPESKSESGQYPNTLAFISRNPKGSVTIRMGNKTLELKVCGAKSKYTGQVQITDGNRYPNNLYYGRIDKTGGFSPYRECTDEVVEHLREFEKNPERYAVEYGKRTGICVFCNADLTDEVSVAVGYGPICEKVWSMPRHTRYTRKSKKLAKVVENPAPVEMVEDREAEYGYREQIEEMDHYYTRGMVSQPMIDR